MIHSKSAFNLKKERMRHVMQFDKDVYFYVEGTGLTESYPVHFCVAGSNDEALVVMDATIEDDGRFKVKIPNILLQKAQTIVAYIYVDFDNGERSIFRIEIAVLPRQRPHDYLDPNYDDYLSLEQIKKDMINYLNETADAIRAELDADADSGRFDGKSPYIGEDEYWYVWDAENKEYYNTGYLVNPPVDAEKVSAAVEDYFEINPIIESDPTVPAWAKESSKPTYTAEEVGALPDDTFIPSKVSELKNDSGYLTTHQDISGKQDVIDDLDEIRTGAAAGYTALQSESDPTVPEWAKQETKPTYTAEEVGALPANTHIPSAISELTNDAGYLTEHQSLAEYVKDSELSSVAKSGNYYDLANRPDIPPDLSNELIAVNEELANKQPVGDYALKSEIPENVSELTNDANYASTSYVDNAVTANTAYYISNNGEPFESVEALEAYSGTLTNNDYALVVGTDELGGTTYTRYKYNAGTSEWAKEYVLNNSSFTSEQWAAITSGITSNILQSIQSGIQSNTSALGGKVDKEDGKGLSANDYSDDEKAKVQHVYEYATEKCILTYDGSKITDIDSNVLTFENIYNILLESPDFVVIVYGNRVYHPAYIEYVEGGESQIYFNATMIDGGHTKTNRIYIRSADGIEIAGISTTPVVNENVSNKVIAITSENKERTDLYPSVAAAVDFAEAEAEKRYALPDGGIPVDDLSDAVKCGLTAPVEKTEEMNQPVGKDADGKLWTKPSPTVVEVDETLEVSGAPADAKTVGDKLDEKVDVKSTVVYYEESAEDDEEYDEYVLYDEFSGEVNQLKEDLAGKIDAPENPVVGKVLKVLSVNEDGTFVCEWSDVEPVGSPEIIYSVNSTANVGTSLTVVDSVSLSNGLYIIYVRQLGVPSSILAVSLTDETGTELTATVGSSTSSSISAQCAITYPILVEKETIIKYRAASSVALSGRAYNFTVLKIK